MSHDIAMYLELRRFVDVLYDIQDVRMRTANRLRQMPKQTREVYVKPLLKVESTLTNQIEGLLARVPIYTDFLYNVRGVGPRISGSIIANTMIRFERIDKDEFKKLDDYYKENPLENLDPYSYQQYVLAQKTERGGYLIPVMRGIEAFDTVSKYWAWCGLHVVDGKAPKRSKGSTVNWNPKMRTLAWKIGKQFVIQGDYYRMLYDREKILLNAKRMPIGVCPKYDECKAKLKKRSEPACKGHIDAMSRRKAVKLFMSHMWAKWRELEGLPVSEPYAIEKLGHKTYITHDQKAKQPKTK